MRHFSTALIALILFALQLDALSSRRALAFDLDGVESNASFDDRAEAFEPFDGASALSNGVWAELMFEDMPVETVSDDPASALEESRDLLSDASISWGRRRLGTLFGQPRDDDGFIFRGQSAVPPTESPSSSISPVASGPTNYQIQAYSQPNSVIPPVVGDDVYTPRQKSIDSDSTTIERAFRYGQNLSIGYTYITKGKVDKGLGVNELDANLLFAIPCEALKANSINSGYLLLRPEFTYTALGYPYGYQKTETLSLFDLGVSTALAVNMNDFEGFVETKLGVASTFKHVKGRAFYATGRAWGALSVDTTGRLKLLGGVAYYDRIRYKLVPIAGALWRPNEKNILRLVYPDPEWQHFLTKNENGSEWWFFVHGQIGGGRWVGRFPDDPIDGKSSYVFDYNDYRVGAGVNFVCPKGLRGAFEIGGAFGRELRTKRAKEYAPKSALYLRVNLGF